MNTNLIAKHLQSTKKNWKQTNSNLCFNIQPKPAGGYVENHLSDKQTKCKCETQGAQQKQQRQRYVKQKQRNVKEWAKEKTMKLFSNLHFRR